MSKVEIRTGIPAGAQESSFMNATLQSRWVGDEQTVAFSIATTVDVPEAVGRDEASVTVYLGQLLRRIANDYPEISFEVEIGPDVDEIDD